MALKSRIALGLAALLALLVVWILPSRSCEALDRRSSYALSVCGGYWNQRNAGYESSLQNAKFQLTNRLREITLADTLRQAMSTGGVVRSPDGSVAVIYEEPLSADQARGWLAMAVAERDHVPGAGTAARIVVALRSAAWRSLAEKMLLGRRALSLPGAERFVSAVDSTCFVVLRIDRVSNAGQITSGIDGGRIGTFLGQCSLVGRFGLPGRAIERNIASLYSSNRMYWGSGGLRSSVLPDLREARRTFTIDTWDYRAKACVLGSIPSCDAYMGFGRAPEDWGWNESYGKLRAFTAWLLVQDADRFAQFWRSSRPLQQAVTEAYGRPSGELVQAWAQRRYEAVAGGPTARGKTLVATLGWFGAVLIIAMVVGTRRRVPA